MREIKHIIKFSFKGDNDILNFCDPKLKEQTLEDLSEDIYNKIIECAEINPNNEFCTVWIDKKKVGYFYLHYNPNVLVSFCINKNYRNASTSKRMFNNIVKKFLGQPFVTYMWERNTRAIKWLEKCGMRKDEYDMKEVIKLKM